MLNNTIVALSTPFMESAIAVIRLSGNDAINIVNKMFTKDLTNAKSQTVHYGYLKYNDEINYNMGFDGIYPYIADICTNEQKERIENNINDGLFTKYGVSVVDTRAPYYSREGYWNGSIWMPHQWILFKAYLDHGKGDMAYKIAKCALDVWKNEVELTYNTYEHFMIENGRGSGFHQFSGLSTPVLMWYDSYFVPGNITGGFQTMFDNIKWNDTLTGVEFDVLNTLENSKIIVCLDEKFEYEFYVNSNLVNSTKITNGAYEIDAKIGAVKIKIKD